MVEKIKKTILIDNIHDASILYGNHDKYLRLIKSELGVDIIARDGMVKVAGDEDRVKIVNDIFNLLINIVKSSGRLRDDDVNNVIKDKTNGYALNKERAPEDIESLSPEDAKTKGSETLWNINKNNCRLHKSISNNGGLQDEKTAKIGPDSFEERIEEQLQIDVFCKGAAVKPKTEGQRKYVETIKKNDVVFCIGPAGTGKTYLAVALALSALKNDLVEKIVLARPAVEAGERLGFLPGDIHAKVNPYLRPLYDALANMMDTGQVKKYIENDLIEILPLAFMRGRSLNRSFIILDEAQNCTTKQMKTFLTRLGIQSRIVVTGDVTQIDLPSGETSGLIDVQKKLTNIPGIAFVHLDKKDIIRHKLIQDIVDAYENGKIC